VTEIDASIPNLAPFARKMKQSRSNMINVRLCIDVSETRLSFGSIHEPLSRVFLSPIRHTVQLTHHQLFVLWHSHTCGSVGYSSRPAANSLITNGDLLQTVVLTGSDNPNGIPRLSHSLASAGPREGSPRDRGLRLTTF
jgi:hypothetical protein